MQNEIMIVMVGSLADGHLGVRTSVDDSGYKSREVLGVALLGLLNIINHLAASPDARPELLENTISALRSMAAASWREKE